MRRIADVSTTRAERARIQHREQELARALVRALDDNDLGLMFTALRSYGAVLKVQPGTDWDDIRTLENISELVREAKIARPFIEQKEGN